MKRALVWLGNATYSADGYNPQDCHGPATLYDYTDHAFSVTWENVSKVDYPLLGRHGRYRHNLPVRAHMPRPVIGGPGTQGAGLSALPGLCPESNRSPARAEGCRLPHWPAERAREGDGCYLGHASSRETCRRTAQRAKSRRG